MTPLTAVQIAAGAGTAGHRLAVYALTAAIYLACLAAAACSWRRRGRDKTRESADDDGR